MSDASNQNDEITIPAQAPEPTPQPASKSQLFKEALEQYSDRETAKSHIKEIAEKLQSTKSLGYKVIKDIVFPNEQGQAPPAQEPTARIPEQPPEAIPETPTPEQPAEAQVTEQPQEFAPLPAPTEQPEHVAVTPTVAKLEPILERSVRRLFNSAIENLSGAQETLTDQEAKDTAILLPIMVWRLTKVNLSEDQFIDMTCVTHFGSIILKVVAPKLKAWLKPKPETPEPKPRKPPKPEPDKAQQALPIEPPTPEPAPESYEKPDGKNILARLPA